MDTINALDFKTLLALLPKRELQAHKGNFGHVLVIGGDFGYPGAPVLAALGALRVGAGLVSLASHQATITGINAYHPEIMCHAIDDPATLSPLLSKATVIILGPGLGRTLWSQQIYDIASNIHLPLVLDADGLFFLAQQPNKNPKRILTPHPGEAANLLNKKQAIAQEQRITALEDLLAKYNSTIVLKGAGTLVASPNSKAGICTNGNPGMASGGMGDLLSGIIGGLLAQGMIVDQAAKLGVCVHAMAGDIAAQSGQRGIIATDLLLPIKQLMS
jgi:ADP-dependent NAD(P)H-hydrate dehydratase / NAD(P)H-hydrate epimerase